MSDIAVVDTPDVTMITSIAGSQHVKDLVKRLTKANRSEAVRSKAVEEPWGVSREIQVAESFRIKLLVLEPGYSLPARFHHHRSLHWTVVGGTIEVTLDGSPRYLKVNQSIQVQECTVHTLHNPGRLPAHVVAVEYGTYLGEDDVVIVDEEPTQVLRAAIAAE